VNPCVELDGLLAERASGELAPEDQARLDAHLPSCERCRAELAGYEDALDLMRVPGGSTSRDTVAPSPSPRAEGRGPGTGAPTERGREHPDLALSTLAAWGRYRRRRIAGLALGAGLLSMAAAAALALAPGLFAKRVPHALETAAPGAVSEPDLAVSEPDLAVSEPDLAVSEPDLAVSEPDVDESVEASALASSQDEEEITSEDVALAALDAAEQP
jgi:anti-sigma factor RsiW